MCVVCVCARTMVAVCSDADAAVCCHRQSTVAVLHMNYHCNKYPQRTQNPPSFFYIVKKKCKNSFGYADSVVK